MPKVISPVVAEAKKFPTKYKAVLKANSRFVYHVDNTYSPPGIYPDSIKPSSNRVDKYPPRLLMNA